METKEDIMKNNPLYNGNNEPCPRCDSKKTKMNAVENAVNGSTLLFVGLFLIFIGGILSIFLVGIPILLIGIWVTVLGFMRSLKRPNMICEDCYYKWEHPEVRKKREAKENKKKAKQDKKNKKKAS